MEKLYGELTREQAKDFDSLILELQELNGGPVPERKIVKRIKPLGPGKNERLWKYILHCCELVIVSPMYHKVLKKVAAMDPFNTKEEILEDWKLNIAPYVYRYVWRKYHHSEKCEYAITTARFALQDFLGKHSWGNLVPTTSEQDYDALLAANDGHKKVQNQSLCKDLN